MSPASIDKRFATVLRGLLALAFLLPAVTMTVGMSKGGLSSRLRAVPPMWNGLTPGWVWLVPLLVQFRPLVCIVALDYVFVWTLVDGDAEE